MTRENDRHQFEKLLECVLNIPKGNVKYGKSYHIYYGGKNPPDISFEVNHFDENGNLIYMQSQSSPDSPVEKDEWRHDDNGKYLLYLHYEDVELVTKETHLVYSYKIESEHYKDERKKNEWLYLSMYGKSSPDPCQYNIVYEEFINKEKYKKYEDEDRRKKEKERYEEEKKEDFYRNHPYHTIYDDKNQLIEVIFWNYIPEQYYNEIFGHKLNKQFPLTERCHYYFSNFDEHGNWLTLYEYVSFDGIHDMFVETTHRIIEYY